IHRPNCRPPDIHPMNKCAKFQPNPTIFEVSSLPQSFSLVLAKNSSPVPKNQNFRKLEKTPPDIHLRNECAKFQPNPTIFEVSRLPQSFSLVLAKNSSPVPKIKIFKKWKKTPPDIHLRNECAKFQPNPTIFEVSRLPQSFSLVLAKNSSPGPKNQNF
uniref:Uncharacterized protein n=1 Tax=Clytia hemisphaerica TaxID=252671 RepID=A0A7M5V7R9_9CNID